jgi:uncharacterized pyridoxal phosphate-containing UPF0001 family protein
LGKGEFHVEQGYNAEFGDGQYLSSNVALRWELYRRLKEVTDKLAGEATKFGFLSEALPRALEEIARLPNLEVRGLMTVAPLVKDPQEVRPVFSRLRELAQALGLQELSMGMSDDFEVAVEEGATQVRLGRAIFGPRPGML